MAVRNSHPCSAGAAADWRLSVLKQADRPSKAAHQYDLHGAITITASMLALVYSVVEAPTHGRGDPLTIGGLAVSVALPVAFVVAEKRSKVPLVRLGIPKTRDLGLR
jgi:hypothetical protein